MKEQVDDPRDILFLRRATDQPAEHRADLGTDAAEAGYRPEQRIEEGGPHAAQKLRQARRQRHFAGDGGALHSYMLARSDGPKLGSAPLLFWCAMKCPGIDPDFRGHR